MISTRGYMNKHILFFILSNVLLWAVSISATHFVSNEQILHCIQRELNEAGLGGDPEVEQLVSGLQYNVQRSGPGVCNEQYGPVLGVVASHGFTFLAEMLLEAGAYIDERSLLQDNSTPLMRAATSHKHLEMVELLLAYKADPLAKDKHGDTARKIAKKWLAFMKETHETENKINKQKAIIERLAWAESAKIKNQFMSLAVF
jgi:hypothetical protein